MNQTNNDELDLLDQLVQEAKSGSQAARDELIEQLQDYLNLMAKGVGVQDLNRKLGHSDIVQQSMLEVVRGIDNFRGQTGAEARAWARTILNNQAKRTVRDFRRAKRDVNRERHHNDSRDQQIVLRDINPTPQTDALQRERSELLTQAIDNLSEDHATVIRLRSIERRPFREVAELMERSEDSVTNLWYRAVKKLREQLDSANESST